MVFIDMSDVQNELEYSTWEPTTSDSLRALWEKYYHKIDHFFEHRSLVYLHIIRPILFGVTTQRLHDAFFGVTEKYNTEKENKYHDDIARWSFDDEVYQDWGQKGVAYEVNYIDLLYELCKKNNIKMSIAVYPWPENIKSNDTHSREVSIWQNYVHGKDISFYNFFPTFQATSTSQKYILDNYFIYRDIHWNALGHELIAQDWLKKYRPINKK